MVITKFIHWGQVWSCSSVLEQSSDLAWMTSYAELVNPREEDSVDEARPSAPHKVYHRLTCRTHHVIKHDIIICLLQVFPTKRDPWYGTSPLILLSSGGRCSYRIWSCWGCVYFRTVINKSVSFLVFWWCWYNSFFSQLMFLKFNLKSLTLCVWYCSSTATFPLLRQSLCCQFSGPITSDTKTNFPLKNVFKGLVFLPKIA